MDVVRRLLICSKREAYFELQAFLQRADLKLKSAASTVSSRWRQKPLEVFSMCVFTPYLSGVIEVTEAQH